MVDSGSWTSSPGEMGAGPSPGRCGVDLFHFRIHDGRSSFHILGIRAGLFIAASDSPNDRQPGHGPALYHQLANRLFAVLSAVVFGTVAKDSNRERVVYGLKVFAEFMVIGLVLAWILYFIPY